MVAVPSERVLSILPHWGSAQQGLMDPRLRSPCFPNWMIQVTQHYSDQNFQSASAA